MAFGSSGVSLSEGKTESRAREEKGGQRAVCKWRGLGSFPLWRIRVSFRQPAKNAFFVVLRFHLEYGDVSLSTPGVCVRAVCQFSLLPPTTPIRARRLLCREYARYIMHTCPIQFAEMNVTLDSACLAR